jgi:hypothetical protein
VRYRSGAPAGQRPRLPQAAHRLLDPPQSP